MTAAALLRAASGSGSTDLVQLLPAIGAILLGIGALGTWLSGRAASRRFIPDTYREMVETIARERDGLRTALQHEEDEHDATRRERDEWREKYFAVLRHPAGADTDRQAGQP